MAKRKKKKLTAKQAEYKKQQKRLERYIREGRKFGYEAQFNIPSMPSRVTEKALREIKQIKPKDIRVAGFKEISSGQIYYGENYRVRLNVKKGKFPTKKHKDGKSGRGIIPAHILAYENLYPTIKNIIELLSDYVEFLNFNYYHWSMVQVSQAQWEINEIQEKLIKILSDDDKLTYLYITEQDTQMKDLTATILKDSHYERVIFAVRCFLKILDIEINPTTLSAINEFGSYDEDFE